ncbi:glycosyltransferase [Herpetosiphon llansteffanensis]|uniref:glycosyltransferase n=1 Tax=Herpetosiphon llansteffanensis TaxID=2094568 RepID=UPI000D7C83D7|nr:glycosyltransferase [Herpetosiphon llansteffanensis]
MDRPSVSIIVINFNGKKHLVACLTSLLAQRYPSNALDIIVVDNASLDGSCDLIRQQFPSIRLIENRENLGFAPAVNQAVRLSQAQYVALINNDAKADPDWIAQLVAEIEAHRAEKVIAVGAKMLDWEGQQIDFIQAALNIFGHGNQPFTRMPAASVLVQAGPQLFACGGAMLADRAAFLAIGGFDESYFAYFEDVDFGWRAWLLGYQVRFTPAAVVYHRQHATANTMGGHQIRSLLERNALRTIIKHYADEQLWRILPAALLLIIQRSLLDGAGGFDRKEFDLRLRNQGDQTSTMQVPKIMLSYIAALGDVIDGWDALWAERQRIQQLRQRSDAELFKLFEQPFGLIDIDIQLHMQQQTMVESFKLRELMPHPTTNVLIISIDPLQAALAGPAIRSVQIAKQLSQHCKVVLAAPDRADLTIANVQTIAFPSNDGTSLGELALNAEVIIVQGYSLQKYPQLLNAERILVVDLYDPFHFEALELAERRGMSLERAIAVNDASVEAISEQLALGDFFICASERQRDLWLGALTVSKRITPEHYRNDPTLRKLIDLVPFGLPNEPPQATKPVMRGVIDGIKHDDVIALWGGGIWEWLDPLTIIRAMAKLQQSHPQLKLVFMGGQHPNSHDVGVMQRYTEAVDLAKELGLYAKTVFFNQTWVEYDQRVNYLLEADLGVSAHHNHTETRFAFRTRLLDYIWASLPMIVSAGDSLADVVQQEQLGQVVAIEDVQGWVAALAHAADTRANREQRQAQFAQVQQAYTWQQACAPLIEFCRQPQYAADKRRNVKAQSKQAGHTSMRYRMDELDRVVAEKNEHIAHLEQHIKAMENGKVMRLLKWATRLRKG